MFFVKTVTILPCLFLIVTGLVAAVPNEHSETLLYGNDSLSISNILASRSSFTTRANPSQAIVELFVFVDKSLGDKFGQDLVKIYDYLTVIFWDINNRYKTLPGVNLSFRIVGVKVARTISEQPFIRTSIFEALRPYADWLVQNRNTLPKYDLGLLFSAEAKDCCGVAYASSVCSPGVGVFTNYGDYDAVATIAHEVGHALGAAHDRDAGCPTDEYIMGGSLSKRWFFSPCSNRQITEFVNSGRADCVRRLDGPTNYPISPDFTWVQAPTMLEQCRKRIGPSATISEQDTANCENLRCYLNGWYFDGGSPIDNSPCLGGGRCFRGRCRKLGNLIRNVATNQCMKAPNAFKDWDVLQMVNCEGFTPLDKFVRSTSPSSGENLATPWNSLDASQNGDRCIHTRAGEGMSLETAPCDPGNGWFGWDWVAGNGGYLMQHRVTKKCAQVNGANQINTVANCNRNDARMLWKLQ